MLSQQEQEASQVNLVGEVGEQQKVQVRIIELYFNYKLDYLKMLRLQLSRMLKC